MDGQPGVAEQRQPFRQIGRRLLQRGNCFGVPDVRRVGVDTVEQGAPEGGCQSRSASISPVDVTVPSRRAAAAAGGRRTRTAPRAGARRRSACPGAAPSPRRLRSGRGGSPASCTSRVVAAAVDDFEQRPDHGVGDQGSSSSVPVISAISERGLRNEMPCADAVRHPTRGRGCATAAGSASARRPWPDDDELFGERVGQRSGQQVAEAVGEKIGALGTVKMKRHRRQTTDDSVAAFDESLQLARPPGRARRPSSCSSRVRGRPRAARRSTRGGRAGSFG